MGVLIFTLLAVSSLYLLWKYLTKNHDYFKKCGLAYEKPIPILGSTAPLMFQTESYVEWMMYLASKYRNKKVFGLFNMKKTTFVFQDPELIKEVTIKKFESAPNHNIIGNLENDQLFRDSLSVMKDQRWKDMRATLSPAFTSSKMRMMWVLVKEVSDGFLKYLNENLNGGRIEIQGKEFYSKLTIDIISTCAFGLKVDSIRDPNNQVSYHASNAFNFKDPVRALKIMFSAIFPTLSNMLGFSMVPKESAEFFSKLVRDTIEQRKASGTFRPDVLQLLLQAMEGNLEHDHEDDKKDSEFAAVSESSASTGHKQTTTWTYNEIAAQCFLFFIAGNDTTSVLLTFGSYELAMNQDVQEKLYQEIKATTESLNGKPLTYETLQKLPYLDAVISETLRKHPPAFFLDRAVTQDMMMNDGEGNNFTIPKGSEIWINVVGLHYDHRYYEAPERFMPERFLVENRDKLVPGTYLPFGIGPRNCIGSRFALMEAKVLLFHILSEFKIEPCMKTITPMRYAKGFQFASKDPIFVEYQKR